MSCSESTASLFPSSVPKMVQPSAVCNPHDEPGFPTKTSFIKMPDANHSLREGLPFLPILESSVSEGVSTAVPNQWQVYLSLHQRHCQQPVLHLVRIVKLLTQHVVRGDLWIPTNGSPPCWWWGCQSAICIHDWFEMGCHFFSGLIQLG